VQRLLRALLRRGLNVASANQLQFARYHLTASGDKAARELGFAARDTSVDAIRVIQPRRREKKPRPASLDDGRFDPFGLDRAYIEACWRGFMGIMHRRYWRIETRGLENIQRVGGGVLVGMHRGFMPFDGVMTLLSIVHATGRVPRFLIHPGVGLRFPFLFNLMSKLGGVIACQENADHVLDAGELLGVYPEGIRGAFTMYKRVHRIGPSWRNDCIVFALRHGVPIMPFVTVGSADIFPILGRIDWAWWKKHTEWPFIPITPTFPFVPLPLPSKWHTVFLDPLHVEREYSRDAADNRSVVSAIGIEVKRRMEAAVADLVARRKSIFFGSVFVEQAQ
jgi:1-acyl-sn-glycerol-3-phosphate acyltransferase